MWRPWGLSEGKATGGRREGREGPLSAASILTSQCGPGSAMLTFSVRSLPSLAGLSPPTTGHLAFSSGGGALGMPRRRQGYWCLITKPGLLWGLGFHGNTTWQERGTYMEALWTWTWIIAIMWAWSWLRPGLTQDLWTHVVEEGLKYTMVEAWIQVSACLCL